MSQAYRHCEPTDAVKAIIKQMAENRLKAGYKDANDILDLIHKEIHEHTPLLKSQIADIVQSSAAGRKYTKSELTARKEQLKKDLKQLYPDAGTDKRSQQRQARIKKDMAMIQDKLDRKDYTRLGRKPVVYDEQTQTMQRQLEKLRNTFDKRLERAEYEGDNPVIKAAKLAVAVRRFSLLSGIPILWKLSAAVNARALTYPIEQLTGSVIRHIPGLKQIDDLAPREGGGWNTEAEIAAAKALVSKKTLEEAWDKLTGSSTRKSAIRKEHESLWPLLELSGRAHGAIKTPLEMNEAARSNIIRATNMRRQLAKQGLSPIEIDAKMASPSTQAMLYGQSVNDGLRAVLQNSNVLSRYMSSGIHALENPGKKITATGRLGLQAAGFGIDAMIPIRGVPVNIIDTLSSYMFGGVRAGTEIAAKALELHKANKEAGGGKTLKDVMTPDQADFIMRNLKQQPIGLAFMGLGMVMASALGQFYQEGKHKGPTDIPYNALNLSGKKLTTKQYGLSDRQLLKEGVIPGNLMHHFPGMLMNMGALIKTVYDQTGGKGGGINALMATLGELWNQVPFVEPVKDLVKGKIDVKQMAAESIVPQIVNNVGQWTDVDSTDATVKRYPRNFKEELEYRIPGLRKNVPATKPPKKTN